MGLFIDIHSSSKTIRREVIASPAEGPSDAPDSALTTTYPSKTLRTCGISDFLPLDRLSRILQIGNFHPIKVKMIPSSVALTIYFIAMRIIILSLCPNPA